MNNKLSKLQTSINPKEENKWETKKISQLLKEVKIKAKNLTKKDEIPILSMTRYNGLILQSEKFGKRVASKNIDNYKLVRKNNVVYGFPMDEGVIYALKDYHMGLVSPAYNVWEIIDDSIDIDFLDAILKSQKLISIYKKLSSRTVDRRRIVNKKDFIKIQISFPPLTEQRGIVEVLRTVDECIRLTNIVIDRTEELKRGLMQRLLTRGIGHTEYKETPLGEIPETWKVTKIGDILTLQRGYDLPLSDRTEGKYAVIGSNGILSYHNEYKVSGPGVIIGRSGTLGKVYFYEKDYWPLNTSLYVKKFKNSHPKFIYYFLQNINLARFGTGTSVPTLNRNYVHPYKVSIPPIGEQKPIAEVLSIVDLGIKEKKKYKEKLSILKQGLMQVLLNGERRVELKGDGLHRIRDS